MEVHTSQPGCPRYRLFTLGGDFSRRTKYTTAGRRRISTWAPAADSDPGLGHYVRSNPAGAAWDRHWVSRLASSSLTVPNNPDSPKTIIMGSCSPMQAHIHVTLQNNTFAEQPERMIDSRDGAVSAISTAFSVTFDSGQHVLRCRRRLLSSLTAPADVFSISSCGNNTVTNGVLLEALSTVRIGRFIVDGQPRLGAGETDTMELAKGTGRSGRKHTRLARKFSGTKIDDSAPVQQQIAPAVGPDCCSITT